jgi:hypothetical protein
MVEAGRQFRLAVHGDGMALSRRCPAADRDESQDGNANEGKAGSPAVSLSGTRI